MEELCLLIGYIAFVATHGLWFHNVTVDYLVEAIVRNSD